MLILPFPLTGPAGRLEALRHLFRHGYAEADSDLHHVARACLVEAPTSEWYAVGLSNGGGYLFPQNAAPLELVNPQNFVHVHLSPDAAGMALTLLSLTRLAAHAEQGGDEVLAQWRRDKAGLLRAYVRQHAEGDAIGRFSEE
ncbi:antirestriction protein [Rouxiella badensis]|uniref:antirestriction protein n=1 Tax=Rouxiella badensis TaxID=1646377 RepID=UPI001D14EDEF|nr:antirestriction protein [Rouxiella badensis]MCC3705481.1 antirestriction protein [Rouxiella badensis]